MGDTIRRQTALEAIEKMYKMCEGNLSDYHDLLVACFTDLTPAQRWIPCEERLPKPYDYVLVWYEYFRYGSYNRMYQTYGVGYCDDTGRNWGGDVNGTKAKALAWMPLPEPWKDGQK